MLATDITAQEDIPPFPRSLVDGYAVKVKDTYGAREGTPAFLHVRGEVLVGEAADKPVGDGEAVYVATGAMIPEGADGVVMQEYTRRAGDAVEITRTVRRGEKSASGARTWRKGRSCSKKGRHIALRFGRSRRPRGHLRSRIPATRGGLISSGDEIVAADGARIRERCGTSIPIRYRG